MANLSSLSRRDQVLARLRDWLTPEEAARGGWVDGPEIMNQACGGQRGGARVWELRHRHGHEIEERRHPDPERDVHQYRYVHGPGEADPRPAQAEVAPAPPIAAAETRPCPKCGRDARVVGPTLDARYVQVQCPKGHVGAVAA